MALTVGRGLGIGALLLFAGSISAPAAEDLLHLPIGDPSRRSQTAPLVLDGITETAGRITITPAELAARLAPVRILFVGEEHVSLESHAVELAVLRELVRAGRRVSVGLEMFPSEGVEQALQDWTAGRSSEAEFLERSGWLAHWSHNWNYYREIFVLARERGLRLFGANVPPEIVSAVGRKGIDALEPGQKALLPPRIDWDNADFKRLFRASFGDDEFHGALSDEMLNRMAQAQATWDGAFGWNAARAAKADSDPKAMVVVLAGLGHVLYGLGAERQARLWFEGKTASLAPIAISDHDKGWCDIQNVQASLADYVWGVAEEDSPRYPTPGFSTRWVQSDGLPQVIQVDKKSSVERAGLKTGDRLVEVDGKQTSDREAIVRAFSEKRWGDTVRLTVRRKEETLTLNVLLRRERPEPCKPKP
jgi:uncharacterized iron-regulated protein